MLAREDLRGYNCSHLRPYLVATFDYWVLVESREMYRGFGITTMREIGVYELLDYDGWDLRVLNLEDGRSRSRIREHPDSRMDHYMRG